MEDDSPGQLLFQAAGAGEAELVAGLLKGEAAGEVGWRDGRGWSALHAAAAAGAWETLEVLVGEASTAQLHTPSTPDDGSRTALHLAARHGHSRAAQVLIAGGADVFARDSAQHCPLEVAQMGERQQTAAAIIAAIEERRAQLGALQRDLDRALEGRDADLLRATLAKALRGLRAPLLHGAEEEDYTLLYRVAELGSADMAEAVLAAGGDGRAHPVTLYSPLYVAAYHGHLDLLRLLLRHFPDLVQRETFEGWIPAHAAARTGNLDIMRALLDAEYPDAVLTTFSDPQGRLSYRFPFDLNAQDLELRTPLFLAAEQGHSDMVALLLDVSVSLRLHSSPSRRLTEGSSEDVQASTSSSDSVSASPEPRSPLGLEAQPVRARSKLSALSSGASLHGCSEVKAASGSAGFSPVLVDVYSRRGRTPLQVAAGGGFEETVRLLVERGGANVNLPLAITDEELAALTAAEAEGLQCAGSGALLEACRRGHQRLGLLLLSHGALDHGNRALLSALAGNHFLLVSELLSRLAFHDPDHKLNKRGLADGATVAALKSGASVAPSALLPSTPLMINWHSAGLTELRTEWLQGAGVHLNAKLSPGSSLHLAAITRLDVSGNSLEAVPLSVFQLASLRVCNLSKNRLGSLPAPTARRGRSKSSRVPAQQQWASPVLEELQLGRNRLPSLPDAIFALPSLVSLDASHNLLTHIPQSVWAAPKLKELNLSYNKLGSAGRWWSGLEVGEAESEESLEGGAEEDSGTTERGEEATEDGHPVQHLRRHNLWQQSLQLSNVDHDEEERRAGLGSSALQSINLAANEIDAVPECLACVAPNLLRLNLSGNVLTEAGPVSLYPAGLKHLDLSHNRLMYWLSRARSSADLICHSRSKREARPSGRQSPVSKRRASSRIRGSRSMSLASRGEAPEAAASIGLCAHKRHLRLHNLRSLVLAGNRLDSICLGLDSRAASRLPPTPLTPSAGTRESRAPSTATADEDSAPALKERLVFPLLSLLDLSANQLSSIGPDIHLLSSLSVLNLSENHLITSLPPQMGLLGKLWSLSLSGCSLGEPLKSMLESNKYKTMDVVGYLKSVLQDSRPYLRMKLMVVGVEGIGKTSLLEQLRAEGSVSKSRSAQGEGWAKRMGQQGGKAKTAKGLSVSTVGVDLSDWTFEPKKGGPASLGPITFRTWDFAGQREYYATHQYFLSRRSVYLVLWRVTDGEAGINDTLQWILNIQARAPNAPVIIVGTHYDQLLSNAAKFPPSYLEDLQATIRERFVSVADADKKGLPRVVDSVVVSCQSRFGIRELANLIYWTGAEMRGGGGGKEPLLAQNVPASYVRLEEVVGEMAEERRRSAQEPVLSAQAFRAAVASALAKRGAPGFRDAAELAAATAFLHENGVLLHYDDATLRDLYFLDPQWLCDVLANVITIREINPFAKSGIMRVDDLRLLFKAAKLQASNIRAYILHLLQKFEVGMTWDNRNLLLPSLLPDEYTVRGGYANAKVQVPVHCEGWLVPSARSVRQDAQSKAQASPTPTEEVLQSLSLAPDQPPVPILTLKRPDSPTLPSAESQLHWTPPSIEESFRRIYIMAYIPSGFWSRLLIRMLGDEEVGKVWEEWWEAVVGEGAAPSSPADRRSLAALLAAEGRPQWELWQTGLEVRQGQELLFSLKEFLPLAEVRDVDYGVVDWKAQVDGAWHSLRTKGAAFLELWIPLRRLSLSQDQGPHLRTSAALATRLLALTVDLIDTLLEDWYPSLGTRFVHTSEGRLLVSRLVPCPACLLRAAERPRESTVGKDWTLLEDSHEATEDLEEGELSIPGLGGDGVLASPQSSGGSSGRCLLYAFTAEQCILAGTRAEGSPSLDCPSHGAVLVSAVAPDSVFLDLPPPFLVLPHQLSRGKLLGRGAFGFVFKATIRTQAERRAAAEARRLWLAEEAQRRRPKLFRKKKVSLSDALGPGPTDPPPGPLQQPPGPLQQPPGPLQQPPGPLEQPSTESQAEAVEEGLSETGGRVWEVALKLLEPVSPGREAEGSAEGAWRAAAAKWHREPEQYACRAHSTARQELKVLRSLRHAHIVALVGLCPRPLGLLVSLAPQGALNALLHNYRRSGAKLQRLALRDAALQTARALEYLHQQSIIYRDLKSENVLVWDFPGPGLPGPVHLRLGDYGISRSVFPSGGAKGFGGTEGFMAPEIIRYNGEEEYTEKVDIFSYGMFLYELVALKQPWEGEEQVKEQLLEGGRPRLRPSQLAHPPNVLDLMVVAWGGDAEQRPSASQLVSVAASPEFAHLLDAVSLAEPDSAPLAGEAFLVRPEPADALDDEREALEGELWLSRADGQLSVLSLANEGWLDSRAVFVDQESFVTTLAVVGERVWLGELTGLVRIFCAREAVELDAFPLSPHVLPLTESPKPRLSLPVATILHLPTLGAVLIGTQTPPTLLLVAAEPSAGGGQAVLAVLPLRSKVELHCAVALQPFPEEPARLEVWTGESGGWMSVVEARPTSLRQETRVNHYKPIVEGVEVSRVLGDREGRRLWSYVYPGSVLFAWSGPERQIVARLDASKIAPVSETLSSMNVEAGGRASKAQVSSLALLEGLLYVGTSWGVVIVAEAERLLPITAFRSHVEEVGLMCQLRPRAGAWLSESVRSGSLETSTSSGAGASAQRPLLLTVGRGYRSLVPRFLDAFQDQPHLQASRSKDFFAIIWSTESWLAV